MFAVLVVRRLLPCATRDAVLSVLPCSSRFLQSGGHGDLPGGAEAGQPQAEGGSVGVQDLRGCNPLQVTPPPLRRPPPMPLFTFAAFCGVSNTAAGDGPELG